MSELTQTLRTQHRTLEALVAELDRALPGGDPAAVEAVVASLARALEAHLELEDRRLYPELESLAQASGEAETARVARDFARSMGAISISIKGFFSRHRAPKKAADLGPLGTEWASLKLVLSARIAAEERNLYALHDRLEARARAG